MIYKHDAKSNVTTILWDSVAEPEQIANTPSEWSTEARRTAAARYITRNYSEAQSWLGAPSIETLKERLQKGWAEGVEKLEELSTKELASPLSVRRRRFKSDQGDELDMQAVWRGDLSRSWTRTRRQNRVGSRSVSIIINIGDNCGADSTKLFWRGASALKVAEQLSQAGYNVALYGVSSCQGIDSSGKQKLAQFVEIKSEDSPLDMDKLAALTAMPGFFRTSMFAGICFATSKVGKDTDDGLGRNWHEGVEQCLKTLPIPQNAIIQEPVLSKDAAEKWIDKVLQQIETPQLEAA
jgi:hypothetical protein